MIVNGTKWGVGGVIKRVKRRENARKCMIFDLFYKFVGVSLWLCGVVLPFEESKLLICNLED